MVLKIGKLMFTTLAYARITAVAEACQTDPAGGPSQPSVSQSTHSQAVVLQQAMQHIPNPNAECVLRNVAVRLGRQAAEEVSMSINPSIISFYPFSPSIYPSIYPSTCIHPSIKLSFIHLSIIPSINSSIHLSIIHQTV